jgi:hypothetical protein
VSTAGSPVRLYCGKNPNDRSVLSGPHETVPFRVRFKRKWRCIYCGFSFDVRPDWSPLDEQLVRQEVLVMEYTYDLHRLKHKVADIGEYVIAEEP